jgi:hypothetical protein
MAEAGWRAAVAGGCENIDGKGSVWETGRGVGGGGGEVKRLRGWGVGILPWLVRMTLGVCFVDAPVECLLRRKDEPVQAPSVHWVAQDAAAMHRQGRNVS